LCGDGRIRPDSPQPLPGGWGGRREGTVACEGHRRDGDGEPLTDDVPFNAAGNNP